MNEFSSERNKQLCTCQLSPAHVSNIDDRPPESIKSITKRQQLQLKTTRWQKSSIPDGSTVWLSGTRFSHWLILIHFLEKTLNIYQLKLLQYRLWFIQQRKNITTRIRSHKCVRWEVRGPHTHAGSLQRVTPAAVIHLLPACIWCDQKTLKFSSVSPWQLNHHVMGILTHEGDHTAVKTKHS